MQKRPRDVVVVRVSEQGDREDEKSHSSRAQLTKAKLWSEAQGNRVVDAFAEIDVSGKLPLARRPGLLRAIEIVERAGGEIVYAIDHGRLTLMWCGAISRASDLVNAITPPLVPAYTVSPLLPTRPASLAMLTTRT